MNKSIPYGRQYISEEDKAAVIKVLDSDYLTQGPVVKEFERSFAQYIGCKYAIAVSNGTAALHLNCIALGIEEGDRVITTPITFAASANCIKYCGGTVEFCDIDPDTYLIDLDKLTNMIKSKPKGYYKGVIPVNFAGRAVNMESLRDIATESDMWIIEDACHSPGGFFKDSKGEQQYCGNGEYADLAIFSFHPVKHIAAGEGGMITTNDESLYNKLMSLRTHGIVKDENSYMNEISLAGGDDQYPVWYMEMQDLGYNYRLTDIQSALGLSQLSRADDGLEKRRRIAEKYYQAFKDEPNMIGQSGIIEGHAYHLYVIEVENRLALYNFLRENGIYAQIHYIPVHLMPYYQKFGWGPGDLPNAESYYENCISLPMFPTLLEDEQNYVIDLIKNFINA